MFRGTPVSRTSARATRSPCRASSSAACFISATLSESRAVAADTTSPFESHPQRFPPDHLDNCSPDRRRGASAEIGDDRFPSTTKTAVSFRCTRNERKGEREREKNAGVSLRSKKRRNRVGLYNKNSHLRISSRETQIDIDLNCIARD